MRLLHTAIILAPMLPVGAWAQTAPAPASQEAPASAPAASAACPTGNLLAGKLPVVQEGAQRPHVVTDGKVTAAGAYWDSDYTALLGSPTSYVVYDLGQSTSIASLLVQGDNNDTYEVELSEDGSQWRHLWQVPPAPQAGMQIRTSENLQGSGRYLRIGYARGDNFFSLGEVQAFCQTPAPFPPRLPVEAATHVSNDNQLKLTREPLLSVQKLIIGLAGLVLFLGVLWPKTPEGHDRARATITAGGAVLALLGFGGFIASFIVPFKATPDALAGGGLPGALLAGAMLGVGMLAAGRYCGVSSERWPIAMVVLGAGHLTTWVAYLTYDLWGLVLMGFAFVGGYLWLQNQTAPKGGKKGKGAKAKSAEPWPWRAKVERVALIATFIAGAHTWSNFGTFHGVRAVHLWDTMHYYVGSKYFQENRYHLMYQCAAVAEKDDGRLDEVLKRKYRVLRDNALGPAERALADEPECRAAFTPERWAAFQQDLRLFRILMSPGWYKDVFNDHGYNASPVWNMMGHAFANFDWRSWIPPEGMANSPANLSGKTPEEKRAIQALFDEQVQRLDLRTKLIGLLDAGMYLGLFLLVWWAFGLRVAAFTILMWSVGHPWAYYWTGGGFGRVAWLFMAVAGMCFMKRGYPLLGAFAVTWSALDRVFPAALAGGSVLKMGWDVVQHRKLSKPHVRMVLGGALALATLVPLSLPFADGFAAYPEFIQNSMKHKSTPLTNHMGFPTLMSFHPSHIARITRDNRLDDPFKHWKELRQQHQHDRKPIYIGLVLALFIAVGYVVRELDDWIAVALSTGFIFAIFELTSYYFNFVVLLGPLAMLRPRHALALLGMTTLTQVAALSFGWFDELHLVQSALFLGVLVYFIWDLVQEKRRGEVGAQHAEEAANAQEGQAQSAKA